MLLALLEHHSDLFMGVIWPLIWRRRWRDLAALMAVCRPIRAFMTGSVPAIAHFEKFRAVSREITQIKVYYTQSYTSYRTVRLIPNSKISVIYRDMTLRFGIELHLFEIMLGNVEPACKKIIHNRIGSDKMFELICVPCRTLLDVVPFCLRSQVEFPPWLIECQGRFNIRLIKTNSLQEFI